MKQQLLIGLLSRGAAALRSRGRFDAANEGENWLAALQKGIFYEAHGAAEAFAEWNTETERALRVDSPGHRIRVKLQPEGVWNLKLGEHEAVSIEDRRADTTWKLSLASDTDSRTSRGIVLESGGLRDRTAAEAAASRIEAALMLASVRLGYGFALSHRTPPPVITEAGFEILSPAGMNAVQDKLGIAIYETPPPTIFITVASPTISVGALPSNFEDALRGALTEEVHVEPRTRTAYELFASSRFENSSRSRFLLLVMSVEALIERVPRKADEQDVLDALRRLLKWSGLSPEAQSKLDNALSCLKIQSISSAAQGMLRVEVSAEAANDFREMYGVRSRLVHGGQAISPSRLNDLSNKLEPTVKALLARRLRASTHPSS